MSTAQRRRSGGRKHLCRRRGALAKGGLCRWPRTSQNIRGVGHSEGELLVRGVRRSVPRGTERSVHGWSSGANERAHNSEAPRLPRAVASRALRPYGYAGGIRRHPRQGIIRPRRWAESRGAVRVRGADDPRVGHVRAHTPHGGAATTVRGRGPGHAGHLSAAPPRKSRRMRSRRARGGGRLLRTPLARGPLHVVRGAMVMSCFFDSLFFPTRLAMSYVVCESHSTY